MKRSWLLYVTSAVVRANGSAWIAKNFSQVTNWVLQREGTYDEVVDLVALLEDKNFLIECVTIVEDTQQGSLVPATHKTWACLGNKYVLYTTWDVPYSQLADEPPNIEYVFDNLEEAKNALSELKAGAFDNFVHGHICLEIV